MLIRRLNLKGTFRSDIRSENWFVGLRGACGLGPQGAPEALPRPPPHDPRLRGACGQCTGSAPLCSWAQISGAGGIQTPTFTPLLHIPTGRSGTARAQHIPPHRAAPTLLPRSGPVPGAHASSCSLSAPTSFLKEPSFLKSCFLFVVGFVLVPLSPSSLGMCFFATSAPHTAEHRAGASGHSCGFGSRVLCLDPCGSLPFPEIQSPQQSAGSDESCVGSRREGGWGCKAAGPTMWGKWLGGGGLGYWPGPPGWGQQSPVLGAMPQASAAHTIQTPTCSISGPLHKPPPMRFPHSPHFPAVPFGCRARALARRTPSQAARVRSRVIRAPRRTHRCECASWASQMALCTRRMLSVFCSECWSP